MTSGLIKNRIVDERKVNNKTLVTIQTGIGRKLVVEPIEDYDPMTGARKFVGHFNGHDAVFFAERDFRLASVLGVSTAAA